MSRNTPRSKPIVLTVSSLVPFTCDNQYCYQHTKLQKLGHCTTRPSKTSLGRSGQKNIGSQSQCQMGLTKWVWLFGDKENWCQCLCLSRISSILIVLVLSTNLKNDSIISPLRYVLVSLVTLLFAKSNGLTLTQLLPAVLKSAVQSVNIIVFVPSSFDFIRVHNYFRKSAGVSFAVLSE